MNADQTAQRPFWMTFLARKRFGQHFLHDRHVIGRIVATLAPRPGDHIVEIGPGKGALTRVLAAQLPHFDAVELDRDLLAHLQSTIPAGKLTLHGADALKFDFCQLTQEGRKLRLVGNLPYNISTPLLFHLLDQAGCIEDMLFMLQKEVVQRLAAAPGGKDYGRLSVMIQYRCTVEKLFDVAPGAFTPPPKVDSAWCAWCRMPRRPWRSMTRPGLRRVVRAAFASRRKTLRNNACLSPLCALANRPTTALHVTIFARRTCCAMTHITEFLL